MFARSKRIWLRLREGFEGLSVLHHTPSGDFHRPIMECLNTYDLKTAINDLSSENVTARPTELCDRLAGQINDELFSRLANQEFHGMPSCLDILYHNIARPEISRYFAFSSASNSSIKCEMTDSPPSQNFGSRASSPKGANSSE